MKQPIKMYGRDIQLEFTTVVLWKIGQLIVQGEPVKAKKLVEMSDQELRQLIVQGGPVKAKNPVEMQCRELLHESTILTLWRIYHGHGTKVKMTTVCVVDRQMWN